MSDIKFSSPLLPGLPNDIAIQCIARLPPLSRPFLSLVSKSWHSFLRAPLFFTVRSHLNCTQQLIYINVFTPRYSFKWFALDQNSKTLSPLPPIPSSSSDGSACVVLGHRIFVLGGSIYGNPSPEVWIFDTRLNKWEAGPPMTIARKFFAAGLIHGKIYVFSGWFSSDSGVEEFDPEDEFDPKVESWAEVFDPTVGSWAAVPSPRQYHDDQERWIYSSLVLEDKLYAVEDSGVIVFDPAGSPSQWSSGSPELESGWTGKATVVDGILYNYDFYGKLQGYDGKENMWKKLRGVDKELQGPPSCLAAVGGRLFAVWKGKSKGEREIEIVGAEVEVCKGSCGELKGFVVWSDVIKSVPSSSLISHCCAVGL
eukprot:TRINITY_DN1213_c0_g2_i1.p1 TRINITY_DN1213_c0_g2~~TRINITY_DN1213_c0_g2_i1.p1  ORF type:complete len:399 (+),score=30.53 TRINITY_DN1213_c0_g2_i1:94-1197(+)